MTGPLNSETTSSAIPNPEPPWQSVIEAVIESLPQDVFVVTLAGSIHCKQSVRNASEKDASEKVFPSQLHTLDHALAGTASTETVRSTDGPNETWIRSVATPILLDGRIFGAIAVNTDITQSRMQDEMLRKSEKLAAVGQLTSSIAHEINNPLESITNLLYLVRNSSNMEEVQQYATLAEQELARVSEITLQTLRFHRQQSKPAPVDLAELLESIVSLYTGRLLLRGVSIETKIAPSPVVLCVEGEIRQVINNLVRNAIDATNSGGRLTVRMRPGCDFDHRDGVRITIADTGEGISPHILAHLFEPFYTTKELTGTGLGLWVSKGIIDKHGGKISVRTGSANSHGTVFSFWLPLAGPDPKTADEGHTSSSDHDED